MRNDQEAFIEKIIKGLISENKADYSGTCMIFPTKRAVLYAKEYFVRHAERTLILPEIQSFEEYVYRNIPLDFISQEESLMYLHKVYKDIQSKYDLPFEDFLNYAILLLKDFDSIDQNLVEEKEIFSLMSQRASIERWSEDLGVDNLSFDENGIVSDYFTFWNICAELYSKYKSYLLSKNICYTGLAYRYLYENFENLTTDSEYERFIVGGFNYLTESQKGILNKINKNFKLQFKWDIDQYYYSRLYHEAGKYFRTYGSLGVGNDIDSYLGKNDFPLVNILSCPNKNAQVKKVVDDVIDVLSSLDFEKEIKDNKNLFAIVLADESLLKIVLESFPLTVNDKNGYEINIPELLNISMGRPLKESRFFQLLRLIFDLHESIQNGNTGIYYNPLKSVLTHPLIRVCFKNDQKIEKLDAQVRKRNKAFIKKEEVLEIEKNKVLPIIMNTWKEGGAGFSEFGTSLINVILDSYENIPEDERVFLHAFRRGFEKMSDLLDQFQKDLNSKTFRNLFFQLINQYSIPFAGEPISPIQIIGLLETRALDFDYTYIISCNEGDMPKKRSQDSLFPFEIRSHFKIPTFIDKDASLSYTFYRLFHRSGNVNLYYHNSNDRMSGKASPSRFIKQLEYEMFPHFEQKVEKESVLHYFPENPEKAISITKNEAIIRKIEAHISRKDYKGDPRGLSPSLINTYMRDPITFFKRVILEVREPDTLEEGFEANTFGSIIHEVLDKLLIPFKNQMIDDKAIEALKAKTKLDVLLKEEAQNLAKDIETERGINKLYLYSAEILLKKYLDLLKNDSFLLLDTERDLTNTFSFKHNVLERDVKVTIHGKADRIDLKGDIIRIVDYKTGNLKNQKFSFDEKVNLWQDDNQDKIIQLLIYKYLLIKNKHNLDFMRGREKFKIESGFYFFRKGNNPFIKLKTADELDDENSFCTAVESVIIDILQEILNPEIPFSEEVLENIWAEAN